MTPARINELEAPALASRIRRHDERTGGTGTAR